MFTTVAATSDTDKIETWEGLYKTSPFQDISELPNEDTFNNVSSNNNSPPQLTEGHPIQASLKTCMEEAEGDKQKLNEKTTVSEGAPEEYNRSTNRDLSLLTKKVQSRRKCRAPIFLDPSNPSTMHIEPSKDKKPRRSTRKRKPPLQLLALQAAATMLANKKPHRINFNKQLNRLMELTALSNGETNEFHPLALVAGTNANPNILSHKDAIKADDKDKFLQAMEEEVENMIEKDIFEVVPRSRVSTYQKVLRAVWLHRRKTKPTGKVYRHRSRLCADGSRQTYGIDYNETYSPVVQWSTVRILLLLSKLKGYKSRQVDYVQAFPQAPLEDEEVFMEIPAGFYHKDSDSTKNYALRLKKNLYGLKQASFNWNELLKAGLLKQGFKQSQIDPCLYIKNNIICVIYVDDTIFFAPDASIIDNEINSLKSNGFELTDEGEVDSFLGIKSTHSENGDFTMSQPALIDSIIQLLGLQHDSKKHKTPAVHPPLQPYKSHPKSTETWSYRSAIGMLTYLARNTRPDIEYAVHMCARFQSDPRTPHYNAVKRIGRYLLQTRDKGITFSPSTDLSKLECYVDADFAGAYNKDNSHDPNSVRSRSGCVIMYGNCPITWFSRLQSEIALSSTEAEYIALSTAAREVLPMRTLISEIAPVMQINVAKPDIKCTVFEDNKGAEELAKVHKSRPRTKKIAVTYHHFRQVVKDKVLHITRISTKDQKADIFTKALPCQSF